MMLASFARAASRIWRKMCDSFWATPRGGWEGETLVVETTNFTDRTAFRGSSENLRLIERFTRTGPAALDYEFTVDDPATFARPWTARIPMNKVGLPLLEYACHEGNYGLAGSLAGARAEEKSDLSRINK